MHIFQILAGNFGNLMEKVRKLDDKKKGIKIKSLDKADTAIGGSL